MADPKAVTIQLTKEQKQKVKDATGQEVEELKIETVESRESPLRIMAETARKAPSAVGVPGVDKELDKSSPKLY